MLLTCRGVSQQVTISGHDLSVEQILKSLKDQTGYLFLYNPSVLNKTSSITLELKNVSLKDALDRIVREQPIAYKIVHHTILLAEKRDTARSRAAVSESLTGSVIDSAGTPLAGVSIRILGRREGRWMIQEQRLSDDQGHFSLRLSDDQYLVTFSYAGFDDLTFSAGQLKKNTLIKMMPGGGNLQEIVVNKGYYSTTQMLNTGDISVVGAREISLQQVSDPLAALQGLTPGLFITRQSGNPGAAVTARLRGLNSIASGNDPFYVVDGVPYFSTLLLTSENYIISSTLTGGSPLSFLDPADIESIAVLKDADALAIYGSQGANGAVLITTRKGKPGPPRVAIDVNQGVVENPRKLPLLNTQQYLAMRYEALANDGVTPQPADYDLLNFSPQRYTDWQKVLIGGAGGRTDAHLSISGGQAGTTYLVSGGLLRQASVYPGDFTDVRKSLHFALTHESGIHQRFKAAISGEYMADDDLLPFTDPTATALTLPPNAPALYNSNGSLHWEDGFSNPLSPLRQPYDNNTHNLVLNSVLSYKVFPGLQARINLGLTRFHSFQTAFKPMAAQDPADTASATSSYITDKISSWIIEPGLEFSRSIGPGRLSVSSGVTLRQTLTQGNGIGAYGFASDSLISQPQLASVEYNSLETYARYRYEAAYGRISYSYADKYVLNFTGRLDGSSRFGADKAIAGFGAVGGAWIFSNESWFENGLSFLSFGKLRASYGTAGNDQITDYGYANLYAPDFYTYLGSTVFRPAMLANPNFGWEINKKLEAGLELGFFDEQLHLAANWYRNRSGNQLVAEPLAATSGFTGVTANLPATVQNTGFEGYLNAELLKKNAVHWTSSFNLTIPRNKLVKYPGLAVSPYAGVLVEGKPLNVDRLFDYRGVDPSSGLYQFLNASGKLTSLPDPTTDETMTRTPGQTLYGGWTNTLSWKGFSLDILLFFVQQGTVYVSGFQTPGEPTNQPVDVLKRWQKSGDRSTVQKFSESDAAVSAYYYYQYSTGSFVRADYCRLKNVCLSYTVPQAWLKKKYISNCRMYLDGQDLLTFTGYKGLDPETLSTDLPPLRVITAGLQLTF